MTVKHGTGLEIVPGACSEQVRAKTEMHTLNSDSKDCCKFFSPVNMCQHHLQTNARHVSAKSVADGNVEHLLVEIEHAHDVTMYKPHCLSTTRVRHQCSVKRSSSATMARIPCSQWQCCWVQAVNRRVMDAGCCAICSGLMCGHKVANRDCECN